MNIKENNDPSAYNTTDNTNDDTKDINDYHPKIDAEHVQKIPKRVPYKSVTHRVQWGQNPQNNPQKLQVEIGKYSSRKDGQKQENSPTQKDLIR